MSAVAWVVLVWFSIALVVAAAFCDGARRLRERRAPVLDRRAHLTLVKGSGTPTS